jgi:endonuclease III
VTRPSPGGALPGVTSDRATLDPATAIVLLEARYGAPPLPPTADPFELVLLENIAYLATPARRREAFELLKVGVGTTPKALLAAPLAAIERATSKGILKGHSAEKLRECARVALGEFDGDLSSAIAGPLGAARRALRRFPSIGEPGAEKILLFAGKHALLAPESNGLRVLVRLGLIPEERSYARTYAASRVVSETLPPNVPSMQRAHLLLRQHGQTLCKRSTPSCSACPLARGCAYAKAAARP